MEVLSQCDNCIHKAAGNAYRCAAFPSGIPSIIWGNDHDHREPFQGDNGVLYEAADPSLPHPMGDDGSEE